jgi:predicted esterase
LRRFAFFAFTVLILVLAPMREAWAKAAAAIPDPQRIEVPGYPDAFYYRPRGGKGMRPVIMYLHGRGGNPMEECRKWAKVATQFGWMVCPQGPSDRGGGARAWDNNAIMGGQIADATVKALRAKYKRRVQLRGNLLIGFSEGAFVAMQVAIHDTSAWSRWLILAANDQYWWGDAPQLLDDNRKKIKGVYLFTGETDEVAPNTLRVADMLKAHKIRYKAKIAPGMGHEVPADRMVTNYRRPLMWLLSKK